MNVDLTEEYSRMVEYLKEEYGIMYGAELMTIFDKTSVQIRQKVRTA